MNEKLRVLILTTKLPEDIWLINKLAEVCHIDGIVLPIGKRWKEFGVLNVLRKRIRQFGMMSVLNQALLILYRLVFERQRDNKSFDLIFNEKSYDHIKVVAEDLKTRYKTAQVEVVCEGEDFFGRLHKWPLEI